MDGRGEKMEVWSSQRFLNFKSMKTVPLKGSVGHTDSAEWGEAAEEPTDPIHCTRISKCKRSNKP